MHTFVAQDAAVRQAWFLVPHALLSMLHCLSREAFHLERKTCKMHFWDVTAKDVFVQAVVKCCLCLGCCCTQRLPTRWPCTSNIGSVHEHTEIISWPWISLSVVNKPSFPQFTQGKLESSEVLKLASLPTLKYLAFFTVSLYPEYTCLKPCFLLCGSCKSEC